MTLRLRTSLFVAFASIALSVLQVSQVCAPAAADSSTPGVAVGPQYDSTHVYVAAGDFKRFVSSLLATFGGTASPRGVFNVTPTPSETISQVARTPFGTLSVFGFTTPIPFPFGAERTGYLVTDLDVAVRAARANGAGVVVSAFNDPIGRDAIVEWPGGVYMQLYWHTVAPQYTALERVPENRVYVASESAAEFIRDFVNFSHGKVTSDDSQAPGAEIGRPGDTYRRVRIESTFGKLTVLVTDGRLPYPYGRETTGYEVPNFSSVLSKAQAAGATILAGPYEAARRRAAILQFPGGYIAEIHSSDGK